MNNKIILSIHHAHAERILCGLKNLEIRKTAPRCGYPYIIYMYETKKGGGVGAVVGFFECRSKIKTNVFGKALYEPLAEKYRNNIAERACLPIDDLITYAKGSDIYGLEVNAPIRFPYPRPISDFGITRAPQSWQYLK